MFVVCVLAGRERKIHSTHAQKVELSDSFFFMTNDTFFYYSPEYKNTQKIMSSAFARWVNSPTGPKTTHFWGPVANWGFVAAVRFVWIFMNVVFDEGQIKDVFFFFSVFLVICFSLSLPPRRLLFFREEDTARNHAGFTQTFTLSLSFLSLSLSHTH